MLLTFSPLVLKNLMTLLEVSQSIVARIFSDSNTCSLVCQTNELLALTRDCFVLEAFG